MPEPDPKARRQLRPSERWVISTFVALNLVIPPLVLDLYPFSRFPMFSDRPSAIYWLDARDAAGHPVNLGRLGIPGVYLANPEPKLGVRPVGAYKWLGEQRTEAEVRAAVVLGDRGYVEITQFGVSLDDGGQVALTAQGPWRIGERP